MYRYLLAFLLLLPFSMFGHKYIYADTGAAVPFDFEVEILEWDKVNTLIPRKAIFTVIDVDTGKSFQVQRRAGSSHADVQPLTKLDTQIMKDIYHDQWSWKRRAILIQTENKLLAASMHGMPHGAGALDNGFRGHFCIHFKDSITHRTNKTDLSHQIMIKKAGGTIDDFINDLTPAQLTNVFLAFVKNVDLGLTKKIAITEQKDLQEELAKILAIDALNWKMHSVENHEQTILTANIPVEVQLYVQYFC